MSVNVSGNIISSTGFDASANILNSQNIVTDGLVLWYDAGNLASYNYVAGTGAGYYDCGYGCQYYASNPGCTNCNTQIKDMSGYGNDGPLINGALVQYSNVGGTVYFDGINDNIEVTNNSSLQITDNLTVEIFCKISSSNIGSIKVIAMKYSNGWEFLLTTSGVFQFGGRNGDGTYYISDSGIVVADNNYHQIVGIKTGLNWITYVDGILKTTTVAATVGNISNTGNLQIGMENGGYYTLMNLSSMKIYNKALSAAEVLQNFNADRQRFGI